MKEPVLVMRLPLEDVCVVYCVNRRGSERCGGVSVIPEHSSSREKEFNHGLTGRGWKWEENGAWEVGMDAEEAVERDDPEDPGVRGGKPGFEPTLSHPGLIVLISHSSF